MMSKHFSTFSFGVIYMVLITFLSQIEFTLQQIYTGNETLEVGREIQAKSGKCCKSEAYLLMQHINEFDTLLDFLQFYQ